MAPTKFIYFTYFICLLDLFTSLYFTYLMFHFFTLCIYVFISFVYLFTDLFKKQNPYYSLNEEVFNPYNMVLFSRI